MPLVQAKCTNCGGVLEVDNSNDAAVCKYCGTPFIVEKAINNYIQNISVQNATIQNATINVQNGGKEQYVGLAKNAYNSKNYKEAENYYNKVLEIDVNDYEAWLHKGLSVFYDNRRFTETVNCIMKSIDNCPADKVELLKKYVVDLIGNQMRSDVNHFDKYFQEKKYSYIDFRYYYDYIDKMEQVVFPFIDSLNVKMADMNNMMISAKNWYIENVAVVNIPISMYKFMEEAGKTSRRWDIKQDHYIAIKFGIYVLKRYLVFSEKYYEELFDEQSALKQKGTLFLLLSKMYYNQSYLESSVEKYELKEKPGYLLEQARYWENEYKKMQ